MGEGREAFLASAETSETAVRGALVLMSNRLTSLQCWAHCGQLRRAWFAGTRGQRQVNYTHLWAKSSNWHELCVRNTETHNTHHDTISRLTAYGKI